MKYTQNYHLPQWALADRIMMNDFNNAMANLESGLTTNRDAAKQRDDALSARIDTAQSAADSASSKADSALVQRPYAAGSYAGGHADRLINVGFRPSFVIVSSMEENVNHPGVQTAYFAITGGNSMPTQISFSDTGFTIHYRDGWQPDLTMPGKTYDYIAFK